MTDQTTLIRRYLECAVFVLGWMACEHGFHLSPIAGQLIGIPLIATFQLVVARRPLAQLWARDADTFKLDRQTLAIAAGLTMGCAGLLWFGRGHAAAGLDQRLALFGLVLVGAVPAAFAVRQQRAKDLWRALPALLAAVTLRVAWYAAWHGWDVMVPAAKLLDFSTLWLCEFVALFLVDEVAFRGLLDPYLHRAGSGRLHEWSSAVFLSVLWAIWHLPAYNPHANGFLALFSGLGPSHLMIAALGVMLSFCARRARTLVPSSIMHAFGNAYVLSLLK